MSRILLQPGTLRELLRQQTETAIADGALQAIDTRSTFLEAAGVRFVVRIAENLKRKADEQLQAKEETRSADPFLAPEPDLLVAEISETHRAVLNKFNVVEGHLLIVTRHFEAQEALLTDADFTALWACLAEYESLGFYNGGAVAGASQRHKHLQLVPLPLDGAGPLLPIEPLMEEVPMGGIRRCRALPFAHRVVRFDPELPAVPREAAAITRPLYLDILEALGLPPRMENDRAWQSGPYNLLVTRRWMLLVPRTRECWEGISINALGFAGSLFVRDEAEWERVRRAGPMAVLQAVT